MKRTVALTPEQWLEIIQQTMFEYRKAGGRVTVKYLPQAKATALVLAGVCHCDSCGNLSIGETCPNCGGATGGKADEPGAASGNAGGNTET